jgi:tyrosyl-tRNA synthetase
MKGKENCSDAFSKFGRKLRLEMNVLKNFVEELRWRGMLHQEMPGTEAFLNQQSTVGYIGFDPSSDSLGVGNLVQIMTLVHFQRCGHKPIALVGGATGMVGDPSGKSQERNLLDEAQMRHNEACVKKQLEHFLSFDENSMNGAEIVNNYDWFSGMSFLEFIRDIGKYVTINYMMAKDSVKNRIESGLSFTEFSYQLVQGFDFYHLHHHKNVSIQMGGSDQWGNIVTGTELIRKKGGGEVYALTTPLITKADGTKFGKSESGNVWLDPAKTSPYAFYQFWLNQSDADAARYIKIFTTKDRAEIDQIIAGHEPEPHLRKLQIALAEDITLRVHGQSELEKAKALTKLFFQMKYDEIVSQPAEVLHAAARELATIPIERKKIDEELRLIDIVVDHARLLDSKSEARKMIKNNGLSIADRKIKSEQELLDLTQDAIQNRFIFMAKGKTKAIIEIV